MIAAVGMFRFRRTLELLQASALADNSGTAADPGGAGPLCGFTVHTAKLVLLAVILWAVNPVSAHLIARMEVITGLGMEPDHLMGKESGSCDRIGTSAAVVFDLPAPWPRCCARRLVSAVIILCPTPRSCPFYGFLLESPDLAITEAAVGVVSQPADPHAAEDQCPERRWNGMKNEIRGEGWYERFPLRLGGAGRPGGPEDPERQEFLIIWQVLEAQRGHGVRAYRLMRYREPGEGDEGRTSSKVDRPRSGKGAGAYPRSGQGCGVSWPLPGAERVRDRGAGRYFLLTAAALPRFGTRRPRYEQGGPPLSGGTAWRRPER